MTTEGRSQIAWYKEKESIAYTSFILPDLYIFMETTGKTERCICSGSFHAGYIRRSIYDRGTAPQGR